MGRDWMVSTLLEYARVLREDLDTKFARNMLIPNRLLRDASKGPPELLSKRLARVVE